jgi:UDP-N-acetylglucosamine transferase subunit ALG13
LILVIFGTGGRFDRLAKAVEEYARTTPEEILVQLGHTQYRPKGVQCFQFLARERLLELVRRADLVITQGGFASISECLELRKKIVAVPRRNDLGESIEPFGQHEIVRKLEGDGKLIGVYDVQDLPQAIARARALRPRVEANTFIPNRVLEFVRSVLGEPSA